MSNDRNHDTSKNHSIALAQMEKIRSTQYIIDPQILTETERHLASQVAMTARRAYFYRRFGTEKYKGFSVECHTEDHILIWAASGLYDVFEDMLEHQETYDIRPRTCVPSITAADVERRKALLLRLLGAHTNRVED